MLQKLNKLFVVFNQNKVFAGGFLLLAATVINRLIVYSLVPVYTKILTPSDFGIIGYYQAVLLVLQIVFGLGLYGVQTRLYHDFKTDKKQLGVFLFNLNSMILALGIPLAVTNYFVAPYWFKSVVEHSVEMNIIKLLPFIAVAQCLSINNNNFRLVQQQFKNLFLQKVSEAVLVGISILYFLLVQRNGAVSDFEGTLVGTSLCLIIFLPGYLRYFYRKINWSIIRTSLLLGLPLILHSGANVLVNIGDRFMIKYFLGNTEVGIYTLAYQIGQIMSVISTSLNQSWQTQFLKKSIDEKNYKPQKDILQIGLANAIAGVSIVAGILLCFDLLFDKRYEMVKTITPVIVTSYLINYLYFVGGAVIFLHKKNQLLSSITFLTMALNFGINFLLIPKLGILGASIATALTMIFRSILSFYFSNKIHSEKIPISPAVRVILLCSATILCMCFVKDKIVVFSLALLFIIPALVYFFKLAFKNEHQNTA